VQGQNSVNCSWPPFSMSCSPNMSMSLFLSFPFNGICFCLLEDRTTLHASAQVFVAGLLMAFLDLNFLIIGGPESREDELFEVLC